MHATFVLKCSKCGLRMQQCNVMESCTMFMTFFPYFMIFILIWLFRKTHIDYIFKRCDNSCNLILFFCKSFRGLPQSACSVWFSYLTILEWRQWSRLTFNQSTEILGFVPLFFCLKTLIILHSKRNIRLWDQSHAPLKDGNGLLHFGIWPSETFLI